MTALTVARCLSDAQGLSSPGVKRTASFCAHTPMEARHHVRGPTMQDSDDMRKSQLHRGDTGREKKRCTAEAPDVGVETAILGCSSPSRCYMEQGKNNLSEFYLNCPKS